jgi:hypothetical protein
VDATRGSCDRCSSGLMDTWGSFECTKSQLPCRKHRNLPSDQDIN